MRALAPRPAVGDGLETCRPVRPSSGDEQLMDEQGSLPLAPAAPILREQPMHDPWWTSMLATSGTRAVAEYGWQTVGRVANVGCFIALESTDPRMLAPIAAGMGALASGHAMYRLLNAVLAPLNRQREATVLIGTGISAIAGAAICGYGVASPVVALGGAGALTGITAAWLALSRMPSSPAADTLAALESVATTTEITEATESTTPSLVTLGAVTAGLTLVLCQTSPVLRATVPMLARRNLAVLAEASTIELAKAVTEKVGPGACREQLCLQEKLQATLAGLAPYVAASVVFNGYASNLLTAEQRGEGFRELLLPMLMAALANVVKGAVNTATLRWIGSHASGCIIDPATASPPQGLRAPEALPLLTKTALRYTLIAWRDSIGMALMRSGMTPVAAMCIASALYAAFAQHRDLIYDLMQPETLTTPVILDRQEIVRQRTIDANQ